MKKLAVAIWFFVLVPPTWATSYFLAPASAGGNDSNNGTSASTPWLTPNHAVNCGDTITASASIAYASTSFEFGNWGAVTCSGHGVAWLNCATFDACKITSSSGFGMWITASHWGVQGWEVTADTGGGASGGTCFESYPPTSGINLTDIIFANDIANGCYGAGFQSVPNGSAGTDYLILIADIAYNAAQQTTSCGSGITITAPTNTDTLPGTHIYVSQTFTWGNFNPSRCSGTPPTDGEGVIFDTWDANSYTSQGVMENNISFFNGSSGFRVDVTTKSPIIIQNNTAYGNNGDHNMNSTECGEITLQQSSNVQVKNNITKTNAITGCGVNPNFAFYVANGDSTDIVNVNVGYGVTGNNFGSGGSTGFSYGGENIFGTDPNFVSPPANNPGAPSCSSFSSVIACMAPIIAGFVPKTSAAVGMGYQSVQANLVIDPLFPQWLCNVNLPAGLVTMGCQSKPQPPTGLTIKGVT